MGLERYNPIRDAIRRFTRDTLKDGHQVVAWPLFDPSFRINHIEYDQEYVHLLGYDAEGRDSMIIVQASQFSIQMSADKSEQDPKTFGFHKPSPASE